MKAFANRHPVVFASLLALALFGLGFASRVALPTYITPSVEDLPADLVRPPTRGEEALNNLKSSENLYVLVAALLAPVLFWRALASKGAARAMIATSLRSSALFLAGPTPGPHGQRPPTSRS